MEKIATQIASINAKVQALIKKQSILEKQAAQQLEQIAMLKKEKEVHEKKIKTLEEQQYILKSAAGNLNPAEKKALDQAISKYIREIEKCIALLSE